MSRDRYIRHSDYAVVLRPDEMGVISEAPTEWHSAEDSAMALVADYLRHRYDMEAVYAQRGEERHSGLVQYIVWIAVWRMVHRLPDRMSYDRRRELYDEAMRWLADVSAGRATPDLPPLLTTSTGAEASPLRSGSMPPSSYSW